MSASVTVTNVSPVVEKHHLQDLFECCGEIESIELSEAGECVIAFASEDMAKAATVLSGTSLGGSNLQVKVNARAIVPPPLPSSYRQTAPRTVASSNIPQSSHVSLANIAAVLRSASGMEPVNHRDSESQANQTSRTIYVGNISLSQSEPHVQRFFQQCGEIVCLKMGGETVGRDNRFAFVEFKERRSAEHAKQLSGYLMGDRPIVVGAANNPIIKPSKATVAAMTVDKDKVSAAMRLVREAQRQISSRVKKKPAEEPKRERYKEDSRKDRRRSRSRSPKKKKKKRSRERSRERDRKKSKKSRRGSRSRSRDRRRRRRSRSRDKKERSSRDKKERSRKRSPSPVEPAVVEAPPPPRPGRKQKPDRTGMFFDGYSWQPLVESAEKLAAVAAEHAAAMN